VPDQSGRAISGRAVADLMRSWFRYDPKIVGKYRCSQRLSIRWPCGTRRSRVSRHSEVVSAVGGSSPRVNEAKNYAGGLQFANHLEGEIKQGIGTLTALSKRRRCRPLQLLRPKPTGFWFAATDNRRTRVWLSWPQQAAPSSSGSFRPAKSDSVICVISESRDTIASRRSRMNDR
jgi:hypothetical protein